MTTLAPGTRSRIPNSSPVHRVGGRGIVTRSGAFAFVVLSVLYFGLSLFGSPDAYLSTDTGGKTGALAAMVERGDWSTDLGYWAEQADPEGLGLSVRSHDQDRERLVGQHDLACRWSSPLARSGYWAAPSWCC